MSKEFCDFLVQRAEQLDEEIIKQLHPVDGFVGHVQVSRVEEWWSAREIVRSISEGMAFKNSKSVAYKNPEIDSFEHVSERFDKVFPDLNAAWERS